MSTRKFSILSAILLFEIFMGYGMAFNLPVEENAVELIDSEEPSPIPVDVPVQEIQAPENKETIKEVEEIKEVKQLANPPEVIKAVYLTSWSAGSPRMIDYVIGLAKTTELNAVIIDVKDFSGGLAYETSVPEAIQYGAHRVKILNVEALLKRLHEEGIYVIARITVFQDPVLAAARPDLAVQSLAQKGLWADYKGLGWVDPASLDVWSYTVAIARDAADRGFDEINFDYVRFPSDGDLKDMVFPVWDRGTGRRQTMLDFFAYLRENLKDVRISVDVFGLTTINSDDLGIGQVIEDAYEYFDYVYPMVYPSHYAYGFLGYPKPAEYPYEVVKNSMANALTRLQALRQTNPEKKFAQIRPWLQDFDLGARYDTLMVQAQVQATQEALGEEFKGFLLWSPTNYYTALALNPFVFDTTAYHSRFDSTQATLEETP